MVQCRMKRNSASILISVALLTLFSTVVCLRVEFLNARCGALPNEEWYNGDPANGPVKWRSSIVTTEARWREAVLALEHPEYEDYATRELTDAQRLEMEKTVASMRANNQLRSLVGSWGLLQYLAVPILLVLSVAALVRRDRSRWLFAVSLVLGLVCGWRVLHLAYFTSLGW